MTTTTLDEQIDQWRGYVARHKAISADDIDEMEDHLRNQVADLHSHGLTEDEAFLVAVKRIGNLDDVSREFARAHSDRLWKQLVLGSSERAQVASRANELLVVVVLAVCTGLAVRVAALPFDIENDGPGSWYGRNIPFLIAPFLIGYFAWKRQLDMRFVLTALVAPFAALALIVNLYQFEPGDTFALTLIHLPIALWFLLGLAYVGREWRSGERRMDFVRFTGEFFVYYVLLALGGGVLTGLTFGAFDALDLKIEDFMLWFIPMCAAGAAVVAAWLVEAKQSVVENIAPVLTRIFTPLTTGLLVVMLFASITRGNPTSIDRNFLIMMDLILVLVWGLVLYSISARDPDQPPRVFDWVQCALMVAALAVNTVMLIAMASRIAEFGASANKVVALGLNLVLLVNLVWSAWLNLQFVRGNGPAVTLSRWQTTYLPVYAAWAVLVVIAVGPVFGFD